MKKFVQFVIAVWQRLTARLKSSSPISSLPKGSSSEPNPESLPVPKGHEDPANHSAPFPWKPNVLYGVDVSHYNGKFDWAAAKAKGKVFAYAKATEGNSLIDQEFVRNWQQAKLAGVAIGAYHFLHPGLDVQSQIRHFLAMVQLRPGDLPPCLDWEVSDGQSVEKMKATAKAWLVGVEAALKVKPILYASPGFLEGLGDLTHFKEYKLWVAHYGVKHPRVPKPWTEHLIWQYADKDGLDLDAFNGTEDDLKANLV